MSRSMWLLAAVGSAVGMSSIAQAQLNRAWAAPTSGLWRSAANWSPNTSFPDNLDGNQYNALLAVAGNAYTVSLTGGPLPLRRLDVTSVDVELDLGGNTITVSNGFLISGQGLISGNGRIQSVAGASMEFRGGKLVSAGLINSRGTLIFSDDDNDICDTDIDHEGEGAAWSSGDIIMGMGADFRLGVGRVLDVTSNGRLRWNNMGAAPTFTNNGVFRKASTGLTETIGVAFSTVGGAFEVLQGQLRTDGISTVGNVLSEARYLVADNSSLDLVGATILTSNADITLRGSNSQFNALNELATNGPVATLRLEQGRAFTTVGSLTNEGRLIVDGASSALSVATDLTNTGEITLRAANLTIQPGGTLTNISGGALTGGTYLLSENAQLRVGSGSIQTLGAHVELSGASADFRNTATGESVLAPLRTITGSGRLAIDAGRNFTTQGDITVQAGGSVRVGPGTNLVVSGVVTNLAAGALTDGAFEVLGRLQFNGANIQLINAEVSLDGSGAEIVDEAGLSALRGLTEIGTAGNASITNGFNLAVTGGLDQRGRASVGAGSTLTVPGTLSQFAGATTTLRGGTIQTNAFNVLGGTLAGNGTINGRVVSDGIISPGFSPGLLEITGDLDLNLASELVIELAGLLPGAFDVVAITGDLTFESALAGTLRISLLDGFQPGLGDTFEIITFGSRVGGFGSFAGLNLPNGLRLDPVYEDQRLVLVTVPSPGALGVVAMSGLAVGLRRRR